MKKLPLILLFTPLIATCLSCEREPEYGKFIKKLKSYYGKITMEYYQEEDGDCTEYGFYKSDDGVMTLFNNILSNGNESNIEIRLPYQGDAPNNFYCTYMCTYNLPEETNGKYLISNYHTYSSRTVDFYEYQGPETYQDIAESSACSMVNNLLYSFCYWVKDHYPLSLRSIGLFPVFD